MHIQTQITIRTLLRLTKIACDPPPHITYESLTIDINMSCMDNYKQITLGKITLRIELYMKIARGHILSPYTPPRVHHSRVKQLMDIDMSCMNYYKQIT